MKYYFKNRNFDMLCLETTDFKDQIDSVQKSNPFMKVIMYANKKLVRKIPNQSLVFKYNNTYHIVNIDNKAYNLARPSILMYANEENFGVGHYITDSKGNTVLLIQTIVNREDLEIKLEAIRKSILTYKNRAIVTGHFVNMSKKEITQAIYFAGMVVDDDLHRNYTYDCSFFSFVIRVVYCNPSIDLTEHVKIIDDS